MEGGVVATFNWDAPDITALAGPGVEVAVSIPFTPLGVGYSGSINLHPITNQCSSPVDEEDFVRNGVSASIGKGFTMGVNGRVSYLYKQQKN